MSSIKDTFKNVERDLEETAKKRKKRFDDQAESIDEATEYMQEKFGDIGGAVGKGAKGLHSFFMEPDGTGMTYGTIEPRGSIKKIFGGTKKVDPKKAKDAKKMIEDIQDKKLPEPTVPLSTKKKMVDEHLKKNPYVKNREYNTKEYEALYEGLKAKGAI